MTWPDIAPDSLYGLGNLPYGVFSAGGGDRRVGVRVGDSVLDLHKVMGDPVFAAGSLNPFMARGRSQWRATRQQITELLSDPGGRDRVREALHPLETVALHLPFEVADYVDFYASEHHAGNVGRMFRPDADPLLPNWKHLPVGYHGRAGTVVASGTRIRRPQGQYCEAGGTAPVFGPSRRLDIEAELGFVVGVPSEQGTPVDVRDLSEHVFGVVLVNDWSARDIQSWEYVPLGPFLGKSFATSISAWVVPLEALEAARIPGPEQHPEPLAYLRSDEPWGLDVSMCIEWNGEPVSRPPYAGMYWSPAQMLAHMTVNGASLRTGDLFASGTVSGPASTERGSFLELSWSGSRPILVDGAPRTFLEDGDVVTITATAPGADGARIGLGEVTGIIDPAAA